MFDKQLIFMKKFLLFFLLLLLNITSIAQTHHHKTSTLTEQKVNSKIFLRQILQKQEVINKPAAKTTVVKERLIGQSDYTPLAIEDSFAMKYSGERGSYYSLELGFIIDAGPQYYTIGNDVYGYLNNSGIALPHNETPLVLCDTEQKYTIDIASFAYGHFATETFAYDLNNNLLDDIYYGDTAIGNMWQQNISTFNSSNNIVTLLQLTGNDSTGTLPWDSAYYDVFVYNGSGQLSTDSESNYDILSYNWYPSNKYEYSYDGSGNMIFAQAWAWYSTGWQLSGSYAMTYYSSTHLLKTYEYDTYSPGALPAYIDSFGYTPGVNYHTYGKEEDYDVSGLTDITISTRNVNVNNLPDTINQYDYLTSSTVFTRAMGIYVYNSYNDPVTLTSYMDTTAALPTTFYGKTNYYYELYNASSVPKVISNNENIRVFPNPTTGKVSIFYPAFTKNETLSIDIVNTTGQRIINETLPWQNETEEISIAGLMQGTYWIIVRNRNGNIMRQSQIVKL